MKSFSTRIGTAALFVTIAAVAVVHARSVTAAKIAAGTITATEIAAGSITADRLNVSSLSAISANLGTVTAGTVTGVTVSGSTVYGGSGNEVTLNSSGITLTAGTGAVNKVKWDDGSAIVSVSGNVNIGGSSAVNLYGAGNANVLWDGSRLIPGTSGTKDLGSSTFKWGTLYVDPPTTTSNYYPLVLNTTDSQLHRKTDGYDGTCDLTTATTLTIARGLITGCS